MCVCVWGGGGGGGFTLSYFIYCSFNNGSTEFCENEVIYHIMIQMFIMEHKKNCDESNFFLEDEMVNSAIFLLPVCYKHR